MADQSLNVVVKLVDQASGQLKTLAGNLESTSDKIKDSTDKARSFAAWVTAVGLAAGTYAVTQFASYEKKMSAVQAVTESSTEEMKKMYALAEEEGARTKYSTQEVADGMFILGQAGITASQQMKVLPQVLDLATAGGTDLASAADIMIGSLNGMQIPLEQSGHLIDVMAKTANVSAISMSDYGESMKYIAPTAAALKVPLEDVSAYIAIMGNNGEKGSIATRAFGTSLANLTHPSKTMQSALDEMNITLFDSQGKFIGLEEMIRRVQTATKDMTDEQRLSVVSRLVGNESVQEMNILLATGADKFGELSKQIKNSDGAAKKMAETMMNNLAWSWEQLTGQVTNMAIMIGGAIAKDLRPAIDWLTGVLRDLPGFWNSLSPAIQTTIEVVGGLAVAFGTLVFAIGAISLAITPLITGFSVISWAVAMVGTAFGVASGAVSTFMVAIGPIGWIILAITAAIGVLYLAWTNNWGGMRDIVMNVVNAWTGFFERLGSSVFDIVTKISTFFSDCWNGIKSVAETVWNAIASTFQTLGDIWLAINIVIIDSILQLFGTNLAEVVNMAITVWTNVKDATSTAWNTIVSVLTTVWETIKSVFNVATGAVKSVFSAVWDALKGLAKTGGEAVSGFVGGMWDSITGFFGKGIDSATKAWTGFSQGLSNIMSSVWGNIKATIAEGINWIIEKANSVIRSINSATGKIGFTISEIPRVAFQTGGIVPGQGGIFAGGSNPANHDQITAAVDPGELILNRAQQSNIANQLTRGSSNDGGGMTVVIKLENNTFHGADPQYAQQIADMIFQNFNTHQTIPSF